MKVIACSVQIPQTLQAPCLLATRPQALRVVIPGDFVCGRCTSARASQQVAVDSGATLIVCPASILQQWQSEIAKHTQPGALKVITYLGQNKTSLDTGTAKAGEDPPLTGQRAGAGPIRKGRKGKHSGQGVVSAEDLAAADVVLTTYDVLKRDVHHQADPNQLGKTFRTRKRYEVHSQAYAFWLL